MSTYIYLRCLDHDPPLSAAGESGQHLTDLPTIREDIANREELVKWWNVDIQPQEYFRIHTVRFLAAHPKCNIGIRDEYGVEHLVTEPEEGGA